MKKRKLNVKKPAKKEPEKLVSTVVKMKIRHGWGTCLNKIAPHIYMISYMMTKRTLEDLERELADHSKYFERLIVKQGKLEREQKEMKKAYYEMLILFGIISIRLFIEIYFL